MKKAILIASAIALLLLISEKHHRQNIFRDAMARMEMTGSIRPPLVRTVSRRELTDTYFEEAGDISDEHRTMILDELNALYSSATSRIMIGEHLSGRKRDSIIFHEDIHYLQDVREGPAPPPDPFGFSIRLFREMQASKFEKEYLEEISS